MLFFVKACVDVSKLAEFGQKLQAGEFRAHPLSTYCLKDDPSVGLSIWEAKNRESFEKDFAPQRGYYSAILEVISVITAREAQQILMEQITNGTR